MLGDAVVSNNNLDSSKTKDPPAKRKVFFGWWTTLAAGVIGSWGFGSWIYSFGTLFTPLQDEFGWNRAEIAGAGSLRRVEGGLGGLATGWFTDKFGPRVMCLVGCLIAGSGYILMYFVNSLWSFYLTYGIVVAFGWTFGLTGNLDKAIAEWFVKRRGLATGIFRVIIALQVVPPLITLFMATYGWKIGYVITGLITWSICIPLAWFFIKPKRPEFYGLLPDGEAKVESGNERDSMIKIGQELVARKYGEVEFTVRQAIKSRTFWVMVTYGVINGLLWPIISVHLIPYLADFGMNEITAAATLSLLVFIGLPSRLIGGILTDKISVHKQKYVILLAGLARVLGLFLLVAAADLVIVYLFVVLYGLGNGLNIGAWGPLRARFFGRKAYATIMGISSMLTLPVGVLAPVYIGWTYDITGTYKNSFTLILTIFAIGLISVFLLNPPRQKPEAVSDIEKLI